jgi:hypothetical protein
MTCCWRPVGGSAAKRALTSAMAAPHLQSQTIAFGERHYTAIPAYGFANVQVRRTLLARADENTPERFVVNAAEVWKSSAK